MDIMTMTDIDTPDKLLIVGCVILLFFVAVFGGGNLSNKKEGKHGKLCTVKWGKRNAVHGIIYGRKGGKVLYSPVDDCTAPHLLVTAGSGRGKTSAVLLPTLRTWNGTSLIIDISGDISKNCPNISNKLIFDVEANDTVPYNIFASIDALKGDTEAQNEALAALALLILPLSPSASETEIFFSGNGEKILTAALISYYHAGADFCTICQKIVSSAWKDLFAEIDRLSPTVGSLYINGFQGSSEANTSGCYQAVVSAVSLYATNARVRNAVRRPRTGEHELTPTDIETSNIFVLIPDEKLKLYSPIVAILVSQFFDYIKARKVTESSKTILLALDEVASYIGNATGITSDVLLDCLRKYRKRKCRLLMMTQSQNDFNVAFGSHDVTNSLLANFDNKLILGGLGDLESMETFAKMIGYRNTVKHSRSHSANGGSTSETEDRDYIIQPEDIDRMQDDCILICPDGYFKLQKNFWFKK